MLYDAAYLTKVQPRVTLERAEIKIGYAVA